MPFRAICCLGFILVALAGCATPVTERIRVDDALVAAEAKKQREIALQSQLIDQARLIDIAYPIQRAAVSFCGESSRAIIGAYFVNAHMFEDEMREAAASVLGTGDAIQVLHLAEGSPAALAGLRKGDILVAVNEQPAPQGRNAIKDLKDVLDVALKKDEGLTLTVRRSDTEQVISVLPETVCDFPVVLSPEDVVNAYADGERIIITRGMMRFAQSDTELGLVISHELAHNAMGHLNAKKQNYVLGSIFDILAAAYGVNTQGAFGNAGARAFSQDFEAEADYVGLYMLALAGGDIENAPFFWRRMAAAHPGSIKKNHAASHPATPERFLALEQAVAEIRNKQRLGLPLEPEKKKAETEADAKK